MRLGYTPAQYEALTLGERNAIIREINRQRRK